MRTEAVGTRWFQAVQASTIRCWYGWHHMNEERAQQIDLPFPTWHRNSSCWFVAGTKSDYHWNCRVYLRQWRLNWRNKLEHKLLCAVYDVLDGNEDKPSHFTRLDTFGLSVQSTFKSGMVDSYWMERPASPVATLAPSSSSKSPAVR